MNTKPFLVKNWKRVFERSPITKTQLSQKSGLGVDTICNILNGKVPNPRDKTVVLVEKAFEELIK